MYWMDTLFTAIVLLQYVY